MQYKIEQSHVNHCVRRIRYQIIFCVKSHKKFHLNNDIINYLKYIALKLITGTIFEFYEIGIDGNYSHFFFYAEQKYFSSRGREIIKGITTRKNLQKNARGAIRTHEFLRKWVLNPSPLTKLGNPRNHVRFFFNIK